MFSSLRLGKVFGIPVYVHATFLLLPVWVAFTQRGEGLAAMLFALAVLLTIFGCLLLHELGHALMGRVFGIRTRDITLYPIGGIARLESAGEKPVEELCIALAGPAVNVVIACLLIPVLMVAAGLGLLKGDPTRLLPSGLTGLEVVAHFLRAVCFGNVILVLFNLLPAFPMDGGRVFRALLSLAVTRLQATRIAVGVGVVMAVAFGVVAYFQTSPMLLLVAIFVCLAGQQELRALQFREARARASSVPAQPVPHEPAQVADRFVPMGGFTGMVWDRDLRVWVRWQNGRPVQILG
jgi:Zn-dependent protease